MPRNGRLRARALTYCCSLVALATSAGLAQAQAPAQVEELVVTASLEETLPQELARYGSDVSTITGATIKGAGYVDLAQALQMQAPGFYLASRNGPFSYIDISLQGSRTQDVLFLVDGVRINNRLYSTTMPDTIPASMIERIEVLKGGQSLFYGTQGVAGVVNIGTRSFSERTGGELNGGYDTNGGLHLNGFARGTAAGRHKVVVYGSYDKGDGYRPYTVMQPSATDRERGYDVKSVGGKYGFDFTDDLSLSLLYQHTDAKLDYTQPRLTRESWNKRNEEIASAKLDYTPSGAFQFFLKGYFHDWDSKYTTINNTPPFTGGTTVIDNNTYWGFKDYGVSGLAKLNLHKGLEYELGYEYQAYSAVDDVLLIDKMTEKVHAGALQVRTTEDLFENARLAAGLRYTKTGGDEDLIWNVTGRWDVTSAFYVEGNAGTNFILPTAENLYARDPCCAVGNRNLEPERSLNFNASLGGQLGEADWFTWKVTGYHRTIDNFILDNYDQPAYPDGIYLNEPGEVKMKGVEVQMAAALSQDFRLTGSYNYNRARAQGATTQFARIPTNLLKASLVYAPAAPYGASLSANYVGRTIASVTGFGTPNYGKYVVVDASAHVYLDGADRHHRINVAVQNLFDKAYNARLNSALIDGGATRFLFGFRGLPRTLRVDYTYAF